MSDYEMMGAFVAALSLRQRVMLARGPAPDSDGWGCNVCAVLRDEGYATGGYRGGDRQAADWLLNWHGSDHLKCMAIYGAAAACVARDDEIERIRADAAGVRRAITDYLDDTIDSKALRNA